MLHRNLKDMSLEEIFKKEKSEKTDLEKNYENEIRKQWNDKLKASEVIMDKLSFLRTKGYKVEYENYHAFNMEEYDDNGFPCVRVASIVLVKPIKDDSENIFVMALHGFPLAGEVHTYESFVKKLINTFESYGTTYRKRSS